MSSDPRVVGDRWLEVAVAIADGIVAEAVWSDGMCNWIGRVPEDVASHRTPVHAAMGADLYGGVAGTALFLSEAYRATGMSRYAETALAAARLALAKAASLDGASRWGLYSGLAGIALATLASAAMLDDQATARDAHALQDVLERESVHGGHFDVVGGIAGTIIAALAAERFGRTLNEGWIRELAAGLRRLAIIDGTTAAWIEPGSPWKIPLTGLSHGAGGIVAAAARLGARLNDDNLIQLAEMAAAYEDRWRDPRSGNWADLRGMSHRTMVTDQFPTTLAWCHGAPGIALARRELAAVSDNAMHEGSVVHSTKLLVEDLGMHVQEPPTWMSLCHGIFGNALILLHLRDVPASRQEPVLQLASSARLPNGGGLALNVAGTESDTPGLMLGTAGIGMFYLAMASEISLSPLWPIDPVGLLPTHSRAVYPH